MKRGRKLVHEKIKNVNMSPAACVFLSLSFFISKKMYDNVLNETLSSYRLSETKEIRTLVHYHLATLKKISLCCCLVTMKNFSLS